LSDFKKSGKIKEKKGRPISKKSEKWDVKSQIHERNTDRGDDEDALQYEQLRPKSNQKKGKI